MTTETTQKAAAAEQTELKLDGIKATPTECVNGHSRAEFYKNGRLSLLSGGSVSMASPDGGRGASQCTHRPFSQASAQTTATTPTPHWPLLHTDQNQNG